MKTLWAILILSTAALGQTPDQMTVYEVDGATQTNRVVDFGRVFKAGEITTGNCPQPLLDNVAVAAGSWQADLKNAYASDSSVKFADVAFKKTFTANQSPVVTFQNGTCDNTGFLTQAQMTGFNSGNWDVQLIVTPSTGSPVTTSAKTVVSLTDPASNTYGDGKNNYTRKGPVVTGVILRDETTATSLDFGWLWNGTSMGAASTGNCSSAASNCAASIHPWFECFFFPASNDVRCDVVIEIPWSSRIQDQQIAITIKAGSALTTVVTIPQFTMAGGQRYMWTVWSRSDGTGDDHGIGNIRIDHGFNYLMATKALPNYTTTYSVSPDTLDASNGATSWTIWSGGDKGKVGGSGGLYAITKDMSSNFEGAPLQREDLLYLKNMTTCGTANGACAKAWQILTARSGAIDTSLTSSNLAGGGGTWANLGNIPFHLKESRTAAGGLQGSGSNYFYCSGFDSNDVTTATNTCSGSGATNSAFGRPFSKHAHSNNHYGISGSGWPVSTITGATRTAGGWTATGADHWQDFAYVPYLLTGHEYYLQEEYMSASFGVGHITEGTGFNNSGNFFGYVASDNVIRDLAWSLQLVERAAFIAPDADAPSANYYTAMLKSNLRVLEGIYNITGTTLTPTTTHATCSPYSAAAANAWDWGHCTILSRLSTTGTAVATARHSMAIGNCANSGSGPNYVTTTLSGSVIQEWMMNYLSLALSQARDLGFSYAQKADEEPLKGMLERVGDSNADPSSSQENNVFISFSEYLEPSKSGDSTAVSFCNNNGAYTTAPFITTETAFKAAFLGSQQSKANFNHVASIDQYPCGDHGYSLVGRAAASYLTYFNLSESFAGCASGTCSPSTVWTWLNANVPYFTISPGVSNSCGATDVQIKFALEPRASATCTIVAPAAGASVSGTAVAINVTATSSNGTINSIVTSLNGATANMPSTGGTSLNTTFNSQLFPNATYTLSATVADDVGGTGTCTGQSLTIANVYPSPISLGAGVKLGAGVATK